MTDQEQRPATDPSAASASAKTPSPAAAGKQVRLIVEKDRVVLYDPSGTPVAEVNVPANGQPVNVPVPVSAFDPIGVAVGELSMALLKESSKSARRTQRRLAFSFTAMNWMLLATFTVGIVAFALAVWKGFQAEDTVELAATAIYGGLSAVAFVTAFIARTTDGVSDAGPRAAWIQAIVTTYWSKLAYFSDSRTAAADLQAAQEAFDTSIQRFLQATHRQRQSSESTARTDSEKE